MSVPQASKKATHQVISMGYNTKYLKILVGLNIVLIIIVAILLKSNRSIQKENNRQLHQLMMRIQSLQIQLNQVRSFSDRSCQGRNAQITQELMVEVEERFMNFDNWMKRMNRQIRTIRDTVEVILNDLEDKSRQIQSGNQNIQKVSELFQKTMMLLKPMRQYLESFSNDVPDMEDFESSFRNVGEKMGNIKDKIGERMQKIKENIEVPLVNDVVGVLDNLRLKMKRLYDDSDSHDYNEKNDL